MIFGAPLYAIGCNLGSLLAPTAVLGPQFAESALLLSIDRNGHLSAVDALKLPLNVQLAILLIGSHLRL